MAANANEVSKGTRRAARAKNVNRAADANANTKVNAARKIFDRMEGSARRDVIDAFVKEVHLTPSGASTYYQKFLSEAKSAGKNVASRPRGRPADESSKAGMARALFTRLKGKPRKEIIQQFVDKLKLTPAGAATYYQSMKKQAAA
jgi:hypothetical protein